MRLMTMNFDGRNAVVDQETGTSGKSVFIVKIDGSVAATFLRPVDAIREATNLVFS